MKVKTSVTLSQELLAAIDRLCGTASRSAVIEDAAWRWVRHRRRMEAYPDEVERLNRIADGTLAERPDAYEFGADVGEDIEE